METWRQPRDIPADLASSVVTIGVFDGVHRGHQAVLDTAVREARSCGCPSVALTFDPHPATVHDPKTDLHLVSTLADRLDRLAAAGIAASYVQEYTLEYAQASPREFVENQLLGQLKAKAVVVGEDVRFGKGNEGDGAFLRKLGEELGFRVVLVSDLTDEEGRRWSSTWLRELLAKGDVARARKVLGRPHRLRGEVVHGYQRGRALGFPTANLMGDGLGEVPADGVYAGWLVMDVPGSKAVIHLPAAISVGTNPQFGNKERTVEAHVLGRSDLNLYGRQIALEFIERIRPMMTFDSLEGLKLRMDEDLRLCARILGVPTAGRVHPEDVTAR